MCVTPRPKHRAAKTPMGKTGCIEHSRASWSKGAILPLYIALLWPQVEHCVQLWAPEYEKDVKILERVPGRATKLVKGLKGMSWEERHLDGALHSGCYLLVSPEGVWLLHWNYSILTTEEPKKAFVAQRYPNVAKCDGWVTCNSSHNLSTHFCLPGMQTYSL